MYLHNFHKKVKTLQSVSIVETQQGNYVDQINICIGTMSK